MKNKLIDLNNHLFAQIELLGDESLDDDKLKKEIQRSNALANMSKQVIANAKLALDAIKIRKECLIQGESLPAMIEDNSK